LRRSFFQQYIGLIALELELEARNAADRPRV